MQARGGGLHVVDHGETTLLHKPMDAETRNERGDTCLRISGVTSRERPATGSAACGKRIPRWLVAICCSDHGGGNRAGSNPARSDFSGPEFKWAAFTNLEMNVNINLDKAIEQAIREGLLEGVKKRICDTYNAPLGKILDQAISDNNESLRSLLSEAISGLVRNPEFRKQIVESSQQMLAKKLVQRFGGELEKNVNALKSDPTTRARITCAIEDIVAGK